MRRHSAAADPMVGGRGNDVRAKVFALISDVTFVHVSSDEVGDFNVSLDCTLDAVEENAREMWNRRHNLLSLPSAVGDGARSSGHEADAYI